MAILDFLKSTNYPQSFLEGTFGPYQGSFYTNVVNPAKLGTGPKPSLGTLMKNWSPLKAFTPQMLATGPTKAASTFLKSSGIGTLAGLLFSPTHLGADDIPTGNMEQEYFDYYSKYGDNYSDLKIPGWNKKGMIQTIIHPQNSTTFYTRYGDIFAMLNVLASLLFFIGGIARKK